MKQEKTLDKFSNFKNKKTSNPKNTDYSRFIGKTFNELTILYITKSRENPKIATSRCECLCSCGRKKNLTLSSVIYGQIKSCGHLKREEMLAKYSKYIGKKFGELTILNVAESRENSELVRRFECICSCGKKSTPRVGSVLHGNTRSCGHLAEQRRDYTEFIGKTFGELTVLDIVKAKENSKFVQRFICLCSCGKNSRPRATDVVNGNVKSCGHIASKRPKRDYTEFIGETFGELTVLNAIEEKEKNRLVRRFECLCSCGKKTRPRATTVVNGYVTSCGHVSREKRKKDYTGFIGKTFGELTILGIIESRKDSKILWKCECLCSCGRKVEKQLQSVLLGSTKSCGHLAIGPKKDYREFVGKTFGELTVLDVKKEENEKAKGGYIWRCECICSCGKKTRPRLSGLLNGGTKSCGHLRTSRRKTSSQYVGKIYGELTILNITESEENSKLVRRCECLCSCGRIVNLRLDTVIKRSVTSCGHFSKCPRENYTRFVGEKFGELTILEFIETRKKAMIIRQFRCLCSCGKEITKRADFILYGKTKSCGHLKGENLKKDYSNLIGEKFGELTILDISEPMTKLGSQRIATCICSCGREAKTLLPYVINGRTKTCGFCTKSVRRKDYSYLIGQSIGKLTILSHADDPKVAKEKDNYLCRCSCDREVILPINEIVNGAITSCPECERKEKENKKNTSTQRSGESLELGMRNIHWDEREERFVVAVKRGGKWFKARAKTLEQAIEKREQKLREAEDFAAASKLLKKIK